MGPPRLALADGGGARRRRGHKGRPADGGKAGGPAGGAEGPRSRQRGGGARTGGRACAVARQLLHDGHSQQQAAREPACKPATQARPRAGPPLGVDYLR
jgi:hypothetical protein